MKRFWQKNGWILLFTGVVSAVSLHAQSRRNGSIEELEFRLQELEKERLVALEDEEELKLRLSSENDPAWLDLALRRELGLVPEGWVKIVLSK